jgi:hypothetical protein
VTRLTSGDSRGDRGVPARGQGRVIDAGRADVKSARRYGGGAVASGAVAIKRPDGYVIAWCADDCDVCESTGDCGSVARQA